MDNNIPPTSTAQSMPQASSPTTPAAPMPSSSPIASVPTGTAPPAPPSNITTPVMQTPKGGMGKIIWLLVVLIIIAIAAGLYFWYVNTKQQESQKQEQEKAMQQQKQTQEIDEFSTEVEQLQQASVEGSFTEVDVDLKGL